MESISQLLEHIKTSSVANQQHEVYAAILASIDLTSLSPCDSERSIRQFAQRAMSLYQQYPEIENVASICVHPPFVECVGLEVDGTPMRITSVAGGFPASQTFLEVKALEVAMAIESGADEIDIVIPVGEILEGQLEVAASEIALLREEASDATLKVILETGELKDPQLIHSAAMVAMEAGADFIKTSTGKTPISATPEAVITMCYAIKEYHTKTGRQVGIKIAGGVRTTDQAVLYYSIVKHILGIEWLTPSLFRIGASQLANTLLSRILNKEVTVF